MGVTKFVRFALFSQKIRVKETHESCGEQGTEAASTFEGKPSPNLRAEMDRRAKRVDPGE